MRSGVFVSDRLRSASCTRGLSAILIARWTMPSIIAMNYLERTGQVGTFAAVQRVQHRDSSGLEEIGPGARGTRQNFIVLP